MGERWTTREEIAEFINAFETCTLLRATWTHQAHLTVAVWYVSNHSLPDATTSIRNGIQRYNEAGGVMTTDTSGYPETITLFFIRVVKQYLAKQPAGRLLVDLANGFIEQYGDRNLPLTTAKSGSCRVKRDSAGSSRI